MGLCYSGGSAATDRLRELVACPIEAESDGPGLRIGFR
jgi:hypothetical protein